MSEAADVTLESSPLRRRARDGLIGRPLGAAGQGRFRDGGEARVLEIIEAASDISSSSDELANSASSWAENYHLSADRANLLRPLGLDGRDRVLEIGAGCGAITRYLGEVCGLVDGIEPDESRARVAAARIRGLNTAEVHVAEIDEVPEEPFYDVAIIVGVLEYVGLGSDAREPYVDFLEKVAKRMNSSSGVIVCAIENLLGVKYLCGSPEDHTGRVFDGLTGYPEGGRARTFSRPELAEMFAAVGLEPSFLHIFPDYKMTRVVLTDALLESRHRSLAWQIPEFPSPDRIAGHSRVADERSAWRNLVGGGMGAYFANSLMVVATKDGASPRWPTEAGAVFYSQRRANWARTETTVELKDPPRFRRRRHVGGLSSSVGQLQHRVSDSELIEGELLAEHLVKEGWSEAVEALHRWRDLVERSPGHIDLIPRNVMVSPAGAFVPFDQEWLDPTASVDDVLARGILSVFEPLRRLLIRSAPELNAASLTQVLDHIARQVGLDPVDSWLGGAIEREAALAATVRTGTTEGELWSVHRDRISLIYEKWFEPPPRPAPLIVRAGRRAARAARVLVRGY